MPKFDGPPYTQLTTPARGDVQGVIKDISEALPENQTKFATQEDLHQFGSWASKVRVVTASGTVTLLDTDPMFIEIDPNGANRDVTCPAKGNDNHGYFVLHGGTANTLTLKRSGGATITTLSAGEAKYIMPSAIEDFTALAGGSNSAGADTIRTKYIITPSISTNNLIVALKYIDGLDPSATNKLTFRVGNTEYELTQAMSFTKNAGADLCRIGSSEHLGKNVQVFLYAIGETGASAGLKFGFSRIPFAKTMGDFINTSTDEKYIAGNWTTFTSTDAVTVIGRFQVQNSGTASFNWSIPTANVVNYPIYETDVLTWQPTYSASGTMTYTGVTTEVAEYQVVGRKCKLAPLEAVGTIGGTLSSTIYATLPFVGRNEAKQPMMSAWVSDGTAEVSFAFIDNSVTRRIAFRRTASANWTAGASKYINSGGDYVIG